MGVSGALAATAEITLRVRRTGELTLFHEPLFPGQRLLQRPAAVLCIQKQFGKCRHVNSTALLSRGSQWLPIKKIPSEAKSYSKVFTALGLTLDIQEPEFLMNFTKLIDCFLIGKEVHTQCGKT